MSFAYSLYLSFVSPHPLWQTQSESQTNTTPVERTTASPTANARLMPTPGYHSTNPFQFSPSLP